MLLLQQQVPSAELKLGQNENIACSKTVQTGYLGDIGITEGMEGGSVSMILEFMYFNEIKNEDM